MSPLQTKRHQQRKEIEAALLQEVLILQDKFKFLTEEQLRCRACQNLGIPSLFSEHGGMRIQWSRIRDTFKLKSRRGQLHSLQYGVKPMDESVISPYEGPRKFFKFILPRQPMDQCCQILHRVPCNSQSNSNIEWTSNSQSVNRISSGQMFGHDQTSTVSDEESVLDEMFTSATTTKKHSKYLWIDTSFGGSDDETCFLKETDKLFSKDPIMENNIMSPFTNTINTSWSSISGDMSMDDISDASTLARKGK
ncbi:Citrate synthase-like protein [Frankliniella fusca]|uniref:Citrate synthase-like protein n=1 Tax=Frankliniella fusca TaxID=407009 RepID=A0AAE1H300_9NEOP|nr:Citrate synthase-like protein [Frankliniella fusca]